MTDIVLQVKHVSKEYRLGLISHGTLYRDLQSWSAKLFGREDPNLQIDSSTSKDGTFKALDDISFNVKQGSVLGIIGRNGAGKSTLLKIISKVTAPCRGEIKIRGRVASLLEVGTGFHPELTGRENVFLNGAILGMSKKEIKAKFSEIVNFAEVEKFIDTPVKRYSSGMYVRLAFAVAAHLEPEILIVDEVLAVGDAAFQKKCLGKLNDVASAGRTVIFVSHNMAAISALCNECMYLNNGRIKHTGPTDETVVQYLSDYTEVKQVPLAERHDRRGNGSVKIKSINFFDGATCNPIELLVSGQNVVIAISYSADTSYLKSIKSFNLGLSLATSMGQTVTVFNSEMANKAFGSLPLEGRVFCQIPHLPLMKGEYIIKITLQVNSQLADQIDRAGCITVITGDFFSTGISYPHHKNGVYVEHSWTSTNILNAS